MGKSKYQVKAQKNIQTRPQGVTKASRPRYYDEDHLERKKAERAQSSSSVAVAAFIISIVAVAGVVGILAYVDSTKPEEEQTFLPFVRRTTSWISGGEVEKVVEDGDTVSVNYKLWADEDHNGVIDTSAAPKEEGPFETEVSANKLVYGFYLNLLGMEEGEEKTFELPANVDNNQDGYDDNTGERVMSYTGTSALANTKLVFYVKVNTITKG